MIKELALHFKEEDKSIQKMHKKIGFLTRVILNITAFPFTIFEFVKLQSNSLNTDIRFLVRFLAFVVLLPTAPLSLAGLLLYFFVLIFAGDE
jgi:hypothetical protein